GALDRFAQFFIAPHFTESAIERECHAIDSEHRDKIMNDNSRRIMVEKTLSSADHDWSMFTAGNIETLPAECKTRKAVIDFYQKEYSANIMILCIVGKYLLEELENLVVDMFADIANKQVELKRWNHPYTIDKLGSAVQIVPVAEVRDLRLMFATPDLRTYYRSKPDAYIAYILQHEGNEWLFADLKIRGWISELKASAFSPARGFGFFYVDIELTKEGEYEIENVILKIFEAIGVIKRQRPQKWLHDELKQLNEIFFRFKSKERPMGLAQGASVDMQHFPVEDVLYYNTRMDQYRPDLIEMVLNWLVPENMNYEVISRQFHGQEGNQIEKWFGTEYQKKKLNPNFMTACRKALDVESTNLIPPKKNDFIPTNFELKQTEDESKCKIPSLIRDDNFTRVWFLQDRKFNRPRCCTYFKFGCIGLLTGNPTKEVIANMFVNCLCDTLHAYTFNASQTGLHCKFSLAPDANGVTLEVWGFCEKQPEFIRMLVKYFANFKPDPKRFEELKDEYRLTLKNHEYEEPREQMPYYSNRLLTEDRVWFHEQLIDVIHEVTIDTVNQFINELLSAIHVEALIHGNATKEDAIAIVDSVLEILTSARSIRPLFASELKLPREYRIDGGQMYIFEAVNETQPNSAVEILLQAGAAEADNVVLLQLLKQIFAEPMFDTLRTHEQLGYFVACQMRWSNGTIGLKLVVQGEPDPTYLEERVEIWLNTMRDNIVQMSEEEFQTHIDSLLSDKLEDYNRLIELADTFWSEILDREYNFNRQENECEHLRKVKKTDILKYFDQVISISARERRKMVIKIYSESHWRSRQADFCSNYEKMTEQIGDVRITDGLKVNKPRLITDVTTFRNSLTLDCRVKPAIDIRSAGKRYLGSYSSLSSMLEQSVDSKSAATLTANRLSV
uniref:Insulin-degrading enzyme n=1 Tax=Plectus sambesii TaxID=2011161 RepID=A0A914WWZ8_9BILA